MKKRKFFQKIPLEASFIVKPSFYCAYEFGANRQVNGIYHVIYFGGDIKM